MALQWRWKKTIWRNLKTKTTKTGERTRKEIHKKCFFGKNYFAHHCRLVWLDYLDVRLHLLLQTTFKCLPTFSFSCGLKKETKITEKETKRVKKTSFNKLIENHKNI